MKQFSFAAFLLLFLNFSCTAPQKNSSTQTANAKQFLTGAD